MRIIIYILLSTIIFVSCAPKSSNSVPDEPQPKPGSGLFQKVKVSDIKSQIELTAKNFEFYFGNKLFNHLALRQQLDRVELPKQELETSKAVTLLIEAKDESMRIFEKAINLNYMLQDFGQELSNIDKVCKEGYLRSFDGKSFTYVVIDGAKDGCTEAMERSKDIIQLINDRIKYLNVEKIQLLSLSTQIYYSIENDILVPLKVASLSGNRPKSVYVAFPSDVETSLELMREIDSQFDQTLFIIDRFNEKASINFAGRESASILIETSLEMIKTFRNLKLSKSATEILDTRAKYLNGLLDFLSKSKSQ